MTKFFLIVAGAALLAGATLSGRPVSADSPADHSLPSPMVFTALNPCTGAMTTFTQVWDKAVLHDEWNAADQTEVRFTGTGHITTEDGFFGRFTQSYGGTGPATATRGQSSSAFSAILGDGSGRFIREQAVFHAMLVDGTLIPQINSFVLECVGRPGV